MRKIYITETYTLYMVPSAQLWCRSKGNIIKQALALLSIIVATPIKMRINWFNLVTHCE